MSPFKAPKLPPPPPPPPTIDDTTGAEESIRRLRRRRGRAATLKSTGAANPSVAVKQLLGG